MSLRDIVDDCFSVDTKSKCSADMGVIEWKVFLDELNHHNFQVARMGGIAGFKDPTAFLDFYRYLSSSNNYSQWSNPDFSALLEQADLVCDEEKRTDLLLQAEKILMEEMPIAPIYFYTGSYIKKPYVKNVPRQAHFL